MPSALVSRVGWQVPFGLALMAFAVSAGGCSSEWSSTGWGSRPLWGPKGEPWTIQCRVLTGDNHRDTADSIAEMLRNTAGIARRGVRLEHRERESLVYYGTYDRRIDPQTRRLEVTEAMNRDLRLIKELGVPGQGHFFAGARFVPAPTPDVGNPTWSLERAQGVYSLLVAVFANEPGFYDRKQAAADYTALLRQKGYPAFYHHGLIHSEVLVGEFGEDAVQPIASRSTVKDEQSAGGYGQEVIAFERTCPEVQVLRAKENFAYELWNLRKRGEKVGGKTVYNASRLARIRAVRRQEQP